MYRQQPLIVKKKRKSCRSRARARTLITYQNKSRKLEAFYRNHPKLKQKYATLADWLEVVKLRPMGKDKPKSIVKIRAKDRKKKGVWGIS